MKNDNPILNNPYEEPKLHYATDEQGNLDYADVRKGRRIFAPDILTVPAKQGPQKSAFEINDFYDDYENHLINKFRRAVGEWRTDYSGVTRVTRELLTFWFKNQQRSNEQKLFFAQREAIETAIWLNEVAEKDPNQGQFILNLLKNEREIKGIPKEFNLPRIAFKMATGTGKTVVMAALILYHFFNRSTYHADDRFADNFLLITPGVTIKDRLGVLYVDTYHKDLQMIQDYYRERFLVPRNYEKQLENLNAKIVITNYHTFETRTLQGNKRSPFDGKTNADGEKNIAREDFNSVIKRTMGKFKRDSRLLVLNDEAHHCYYPKAKGHAVEGENTQEENARAAVWFSGLYELTNRYKVRSIYDLSATPYFLNGSGYDAYSLFPWVVSDFGLIEAIESGLVKIPFLPESDNTQELSMPVLKNLYEHVKKDLKKMGVRRARTEAKKAGKLLVEEPPQLPGTVKSALDQIYHHYKDELDLKYKRQLSLEEMPPVFIIVCNNTSVSREVYKYIAGYEQTNAEGEVKDVVTGCYDVFSNYDPVTKLPLKRPPTLLIDSDALENSNQINDEFKKIFAREIEIFKQEYRTTHQGKSPEGLTDADILREVVNTVGKPNTLGAHIRCVVSVSMLTEGWDAKTVTHIMGLRAFGSQLLCEQVAGRALRRKSYLLDHSGKFPAEYAHIIGVPFRMFKRGGTTNATPTDYTAISAVPDREKDHEITFPNLTGYRIETIEGEIKADFSTIEDFEIDGANFPLEATLANAFSPEEVKLTVRTVLEKREQELIFFITKEMIKNHFADNEGQPHFQKFNKIRKIVEEWYLTKTKLIGVTDPAYKKILFFFEPKKVCHHIMRGILTQQRAHDRVFPIFNVNPSGSTKYVRGQTSKKTLFPTKKSHVNYVVADTDSWEQKAARTFEDMPEVLSYVKNYFMNFKIPYFSEGEDHDYLPDFILKCRTASGKIINLILEISGFSQDKADKKWYVENRWLPAVNQAREKYDYDEWHFVEVAEDIRLVRNQIHDKLMGL